MPQDVNPSQQFMYIDAKGLKCPMPVIKLQQAIRQQKTNHHPSHPIRIDCTDPGAEKDITSWCKVNKHKITQATPTNFGTTLTIQPNPN